MAGKKFSGAWLTLSCSSLGQFLPKFFNEYLGFLFPEHSFHSAIPATDKSLSRFWADLALDRHP